MNKKLKYKKRENDCDSYIEQLCIFDEVEDLFNLQQDMISSGIYCNILEVIDFWSDVSDAYCAIFLSYSKGSFLNNSEKYLEDSKHGVYGENTGDFDLIDISDEECEKIKKEANELYNIFKIRNWNDFDDECEYFKYIKKIYNEGITEDMKRYKLYNKVRINSKDRFEEFNGKEAVIDKIYNSQGNCDEYSLCLLDGSNAIAWLNCDEIEFIDEGGEHLMKQYEKNKELYEMKQKDLSYIKEKYLNENIISSTSILFLFDKVNYHTSFNSNGEFISLHNSWYGLEPIFNNLFHEKRNEMIDNIKTRFNKDYIDKFITAFNKLYDEVNSENEIKFVGNYNKIVLNKKEKECDKDYFKIILNWDSPVVEDYIQISIDLLSKGICMNLKDIIEFYYVYSKYKAKKENNLPLYNYNDTIKKEYLQEMIKEKIISLEKNNDDNENIILILNDLYVKIRDTKTKHCIYAETLKENNSVEKIQQTEIKRNMSIDSYKKFIEMIWENINK